MWTSALACLSKSRSLLCCQLHVSCLHLWQLTAGQLEGQGYSRAMQTDAGVRIEVDWQQPVSLAAHCWPAGGAGLQCGHANRCRCKNRGWLAAACVSGSLLLASWRGRATVWRSKHKKILLLVMIRCIYSANVKGWPKPYIYTLYEETPAKITDVLRI